MRGATSKLCMKSWNEYFRPMTESRSNDLSYRPFLDRARWIAASIVAIGHALGILNSRSDGSSIINYIADMRGAAVNIFFVLSGYLIGGIVLRDFERFGLSSYSVARFSRIYIVLIPALSLTFLLDGIAFHYFPNSPIYFGVWQGGALGNNAIYLRYSFANVISSVFSLEPLVGPPIGSAGSLWSLGYEWIFYFALPVLYSVGYRIKGKIGANTILWFSVICVFFVSRFSAAFWAIWLLGAYASQFKLSVLLNDERLESTVKGFAFLGILVFLVDAANIDVRISTIGIGICGFVFLSSGPLWEKRLISRYDHALAGFSYSLYVTHMQCLCFLAAILYANGLLPASGLVSPLLVAAGAVGLLILTFFVAYLFGELFEKRTHELSRWLKALALTHGAR